MKYFPVIFLILFFLQAGCTGTYKVKTDSEKAYLTAAVKYLKTVNTEITSFSSQIRETEPAQIRELVESTKRSINILIAEYGTTPIDPNHSETDKQVRGLHEELDRALDEFENSGNDPASVQMKLIKLEALTRKISMLSAVMQAKLIA